MWDLCSESKLILVTGIIFADVLINLICKYFFRAFLLYATFSLIYDSYKYFNHVNGRGSNYNFDTDKKITSKVHN